MVTLLLLLSLGDTIRLPAAVEDLGFLRFDQKGHLYYAAYSAPHLFKLDADGKLLANYSRRGPGPGELMTIRDMAVLAGKVYLLDNKQRKLVILDDQLKYLDQKLMPGFSLLHDLAVSKQHIYLYSYDRDTQKVVHAYDRDMNRAFSFGLPLQEDAIPANERMIANHKFGAGYMVITRNRLYVLHYFRYDIQGFDLAGHPIGRWPLPGIEAKDMYHAPKKQFEAMATILMADEEGRLYCTLRNRIPNPVKPTADTLYRLNPKDGVWNRIPLPGRHFFITPLHKRIPWLKEDKHSDAILLRWMDSPFDKTWP